jgi:hypothetical protein
MGRRFLIIAAALIVTAVFGAMLLTVVRVIFPIFNPFATRLVVNIQDGKMRPERIRIDAGEVTQVQVVTDRPVRFHIPGIGIGPTTFVEVDEPESAPLLYVGSDRPGRYAILDARTETRIGELVVGPIYKNRYRVA